MIYVIRKDKHNQYYWVKCDEPDDRVVESGAHRHDKLQGALDDSTAHNGEQHVIYLGRTYDD